MEGVSEYERLRQKNIEENRRMLESLGLLRPFGQCFPPKPTNNKLKTHKTSVKPNKKRKRDYVEDVNEDAATKRRKAESIELIKELSSSWTPVRRSLRVKGINPDFTYNPKFMDDEEDKDTEYRPKQQKIKRENTFGAIEGVPVGTYWATRMECSHDGIHRPTVAGIHGSEIEGCYSIALSGGYEDDIDLGESFTYTGEGGRDLKGTKANPKNLRTAPQSKDQTLTREQHLVHQISLILGTSSEKLQGVLLERNDGNLAISKNVENRRPVRVIRGYKLPSRFAPEEGYRYDGLYTVEKCWQAVGLSGFMVYKFIFKRCEDQAPPPWLEEVSNNSDPENDTEETSKVSLSTNILDQNGNVSRAKQATKETIEEENGTVALKTEDDGQGVNDSKKVDESLTETSNVTRYSDHLPVESHEPAVKQSSGDICDPDAPKEYNDQLDKDGNKIEECARHEAPSSESADQVMSSQDSEGGER